MKKHSDTEVILKVAVLIEKNGKLLLIRERLHPDHPYAWNMVKGSFEPEKDADFVSSARRECWEEARARVNITKLLNVLSVYQRERKRYFILVNFVARLVGDRFGVPPRSMQKKQREDIVEVRLFSKSELRKMKRSEFISNRAYFTIREWLRGAPRYGLESLKKTPRL